ncbi:PH domain-containing protein [Streptomyces sp. HSG2]|uniref:PH domain-containing protein n=1 Tax=Streptomyces sp. HSG2 TaxID=2797167 RepID=UPI001F5BD5FB|nr:PH domain-containing protein [Streptomyces sp. HSG2]
MPETAPEGGTSGAEGTAGVERRLHPLTPLRRAWAPVAAVAGWAAHDPGQAHRWFSELTSATLMAGMAVIVPLVAGYALLSWWVTRFSVSDTELRIRSGVLFRRTAHIRLERLQAIDVGRPLPARLTGVAKLRLDVVGADAKDELAYLTVGDARALRAELLARAAGFTPEAAREVGEAPAVDLLRVPPGVLVRSMLLTAGTWVMPAAAVAVPALVWWIGGSVWTALATALPMAGAAGARTVGRFLGEYGWTVGESPDGLRVDRGLLDRAHETVPPGRVQAVRLVQPALWRRPDWVRVELDVAGSEDSLLVPVAPRRVAEAVVERVLPGVTVPARSALPGPPRRAAWCAPVRWRGYGLTVTDSVFAVRDGLLRRRVTLVPHAKVQSVRLTQAPWQRAAGVADLRVDTGANTTVTARLRDRGEAGRLLWEQAERSRTGRRLAPPDRWSTA